MAGTGDGVDSSEGEGGTDSGGTVEEGNVFRITGPGQMLNLNSYRGLQVIDFQNVDAPQIVGRFPITGMPVEMYVNGTNAWLLLNNWHADVGSGTDLGIQRHVGGVIIVVDFSEPAHPREIGRTLVDGWIAESHLVRGDTSTTLFVASNWREVTEIPEDDPVRTLRTVVQSLVLSGSSMLERDRIELAGHLHAIQGTPSALIAAHGHPDLGEGGSRVTLIDISGTDGTMTAGESVLLSGYVHGESWLDLHDGILRTISTGYDIEGLVGNLETFRVSPSLALTQVERETFARTDDIYSAVFLEDRAFVVSRQEETTMTSFDITDTGDASLVAEHVIPDRQFLLLPVFDDTRLIGMGIDDESHPDTMSVSLYDAADLSNPQPEIAQVAVEADTLGSSVILDPDSLSILENAAEVTSTDGTPETGILLLPFHGRNRATSSYEAGVQLYTFSRDTLTRRGVMQHGTPVTRSLEAAEGLTANLSDTELSLQDTREPDAPTERGRLELAPTYSHVLFVGDYAVRVNDRTASPTWWAGGQMSIPVTLEVIPANADLDAAVPIASIEVPHRSAIAQDGHRLFAISGHYLPFTEDARTQLFETTVVPIDLLNPAEPVVYAPFVTTGLPSSLIRPRRAWLCRSCDWGGRLGSSPVVATGSALVFLGYEVRQESLGTSERCTISVRDDENCRAFRNCESWFDGYKTCNTPDGGEESCVGMHVRCRRDAEDENVECLPAEPPADLLFRECEQSDNFRRRTVFSATTVSTQDLSNLRVGSTVNLPEDSNGRHAVVADGAIYLAWSRPLEAPGDPDRWLQHFVQRLDATDPMRPALGSPVNIPGELLGINGSFIYTRDILWREGAMDTVIAKLELRDGLAHLETVQRFPDRLIHAALFDGSGSIAVYHSNVWEYLWSYSSDTRQSLTILDVDTLEERGSSVIDLKASLAQAIEGRAIFTMPGGMLVMNIEDPANPFAQAWFPTRGWWSNATVRGNRLIFAAGPYGIIDADLNEFNLLPPP